MAETAAQRRALVRHRAGERCEYCHISAAADLVPFHLEHVVPHQHLGPTTSDNLALACSRCNCHQGPNLTGIDEATQAIVPLFNPRTQRWDDHFAVDAAGSVRRAEGENLTRRHRDTEKQDRADAATMRAW
jgi:5-methylcytosine-specific restriction endonuclease McrA